MSSRNSSTLVNKMRGNGRHGRADVASNTAATAYGRGDVFDVVIVGPSKLRVPCSNHGGRALSNAVKSALPSTAFEATAGKVPARLRGFVVLGEQFSALWFVLGAGLVLAMSMATCVEERQAERERHQLEHQALTSAELAVHALGEEAQCEAVVAACTQALGHGESCACWLDDDGQGGTWR